MTYYSGTIFQDGAEVAINLVQSCQNSECSILEKTSNHIQILRAIHKRIHELLSKKKLFTNLQTDGWMDRQANTVVHTPRHSTIIFQSMKLLRTIV